MSFFKSKFTKKLIHVQKACKSFTEIFRSKHHKNKVRKSIRNITTFLAASRKKIHIRPMRQRSTTSHHHHLLQKGFPAIFIDEIYVPKTGQPSKQPTSSKDDKESNFTLTSTSSNKLEKSVATKHDNKKGRSMDVDKFQTRDIRGVDERAEDFILKVREGMKLQREQSILDFQEMLARSV